jgi:type II secretory pathway pseudopilin PulG
MSNRAGVTILELVMVMIVVGIIAAISVPRINMLSYKSDATARAVRGALQIGQRNAITRQSNVVVSFDSANKRLTVLEDINGNSAADAGERITNTPLEEGSRFIAPTMGRIGGTSTTAAVIGSQLRTIGGLPSIIFRRDGSSSSDVELYVTNRVAVTTEYRAITIDPAIGKTDLYRYTGTAWKRVSE